MRMRALVEEFAEALELDYLEELERAVWAGDVDRLWDLAPCRCCCHEHTFEHCEALVWGGCRGQGTMTQVDVEVWVRHYERFHGMTRDQFFG